MQVRIMHRISRPITLSANVLFSDIMEKPSCSSLGVEDVVPVLIVMVNIDKLTM